LRGNAGIGFIVALEFEFLKEQHWKVKLPVVPTAPATEDTSPPEHADTGGAEETKAPEGKPLAGGESAKPSGDAGEIDQAPPPPPPSLPPEPQAGMVVLCEIGGDGALIRVTPPGEFAVEGPKTEGKLLEDAGRLIVQVAFGALDEKLFKSATAPVTDMRLECTFDGHGHLTGYAAILEPRRGVIRAVDAAAGTFELYCLPAGSEEDNWRLHSGLTKISDWASFKHYHKRKIAEHWQGACPPAADMVVDAEFDGETLRSVRPSAKHWTGPSPYDVRRGHIHKDQDGFTVLIVDDIPRDQIGNWPKEYPPFVGDSVDVKFSDTHPKEVTPHDGKTHTDSTILKWSHEFHLIVTRYRFDPGVHWKSNDVYPSEGLAVWCTFDDHRKITTVRPQANNWIGIPKESLHRGEILMRPALAFVLSQVKLQEVLKFFFGWFRRLSAENEKGIVCAEFDFTRQAWARPAPLPEKGDRVWCEFSDGKFTLHSDDGQDERKERTKGKIVAPASQGIKGVVRVNGDEREFTVDDWAGLLPKPKPGGEVHCAFDEQGKIVTLYRASLDTTRKAHVQRIYDDTGDGTALVQFEFPLTLWRGEHNPTQGTDIYCDFDEKGELTHVRPMAKAKRGWVVFSSIFVGIVSLLYLISDFVGLLGGGNRPGSEGLKVSHKLIGVLQELETYWAIRPIGWLLRHGWEIVSAIWTGSVSWYLHYRDLIFDHWFLCHFDFQYLPPDAYKNLLVLSVLAIAFTAWQLPWQKRNRRASGWKFAALTAAIVLGHAWYLSGWLFEMNQVTARKHCVACEEPCPPYKCPSGMLVGDEKDCIKPTTGPEKVAAPPPIPLYFDYKDSKWNPDYKPKDEPGTNADRLKSVIDRLKEAKASRIIITGHTDTVGSDEYNFHLAQDRAETVRCVLLNLMRDAPKSGTAAEGEKSVDKTCVRTDGKVTEGLYTDTRGYGAIDRVTIAIQATAFTNLKKPTASNQKEEENRRVMVVVVPDAAPAKK
jgi:hypothetical protein